MKDKKQPQQRAQVRLVSPLNNSRVVADAEQELTKLERKKLEARLKSQKTRQQRRRQAKKTEKVSSLLVPPVEIVVDSAEFTPVAEDGLTWLVANVPVSISGNRQVALSHRNAATVDCGFTAKVPEGYKLVLELSPEKKDHGLEVYKNTITGESRVSLSVRNLGREIAVVNHRDRVALMRIEPIYQLTFKVMEASNAVLE